MENRLDELYSREQIRQLAYSYAFAVDALDWDLMDTLWVKKKEPAPFPLLDIHSIRLLPEKFADQGPSMLMVANHRITFDGPDRASGSVYCHCFVDRGYFLEQTVVYLDQYERHDGTWLFLQRDHLLLWGRDGGENPLNLPAANWPMAQIGAGTASQVIRNRDG